MRRTTAWAFFVLTLLLLPTSCVPVLLIVNAVNPMALAFKTSFTVTNGMSEAVRVTPIGTVGREGRRALLPILKHGPLYLRAHVRSRFELQPGEQRMFVYDWDDINFSEIAVEGAGWSGVLIVDANPTERQYRQPQQTEFAIHSKEALEEMPPVIATVVEQGDRWGRYEFLMASGILAPVVFVLARKNLRRAGTAVAHPGVP